MNTDDDHLLTVIRVDLTQIIASLYAFERGLAYANNDS